MALRIKVGLPKHIWVHHFGVSPSFILNQRKIWSLVSHLKAKNTLEELDVLRFFEFKVEEFPYKTFFYDYDDLKAINKSGYTEHYLGKSLTVRPLVIAKCILLNVFFVWVKSFFKAINCIWRKNSLLFNPSKTPFYTIYNTFSLNF